jgi:hypothetical protein
MSDQPSVWLATWLWEKAGISERFFTAVAGALTCEGFEEEEDIELLNEGNLAAIPDIVTVPPMKILKAREEQFPERTRDPVEVAVVTASRPGAPFVPTTGVPTTGVPTTGVPTTAVASSPGAGPTTTTTTTTATAVVTPVATGVPVVASAAVPDIIGFPGPRTTLRARDWVMGRKLL